MTTVAPWYPLRDTANALTMRVHNRPVEIQWGHWSGVAVYVGLPVSDTPYWAEPTKRGLVPLPPRKVISYREIPNGELVETPQSWLQRNGWGPEPTAWRPRAGERWPHELPELLALTASAVGRAVRIDHVAFNAAEAAAEMENERQWRRDRGDDGDEPAVDAWWRDGMLIPYSDRGVITPRECEGRVMRALYWLGRGGESVRASTHSPLASMVADVVSSEHMPDTSELPKLARMPTETDARLFEAMAWLTEMLITKPSGRRWLAILVALTRDRRVTLTEVGRGYSIAGQSVGEQRVRALKLLTKIANTGTPEILSRRTDLVARNRAHATAN